MAIATRRACTGCKGPTDDDADRYYHFCVACRVGWRQTIGDLQDFGAQAGRFSGTMDIERFGERWADYQIEALGAVIRPEARARKHMPFWSWSVAHMDPATGAAGVIEWWEQRIYTPDRSRWAEAICRPEGHPHAGTCFGLRGFARPATKRQRDDLWEAFGLFYHALSNGGAPQMPKPKAQQRRAARLEQIKAILRSEDGLSDREIARRLECSHTLVSTLRRAAGI